MTLPDFLRLLTLAAIWGGSFLFTRIGVPDLGAVMLVESRVGPAVLLAIVSSQSTNRCRKNWWCLAKSAWPEKCVLCSAARSVCAKPPSWASRRRSSPRPTRPNRRSRASRSLLWSGWSRRWRGCASVSNTACHQHCGCAVSSCNQPMAATWI